MKDTYKKVSIIVGLYNVSKYLKEKKLKCIIDQTYTNWELLLIDDGSTDETSELCDLFEQMDKRIRVIHQENLGLGNARNSGLEVATGDYIWFYDVDDEVELDLLSYCVKEMNTRNVDMIVFGFWAITPILKSMEKISFPEKEVHGQEELKSCYLDDLLFVPNGNGFVTNKFYRRSFIERHMIRFEDQRIQQDEAFNLKIYLQLDHLYLSPRLLYHYYIYSTGNNRSRFIANRFDIYKSIYFHFNKLKQVWNLTDLRFEKYLYKRFYRNIGDCLRFNLFHENSIWNSTECKNELHRIVNDPVSKLTFKYMKTNRLLNFEERVYLKTYMMENLMLLKLSCDFFYSLRRLKKILK